MAPINLGKERVGSEVVFRITAPKMLESKLEDHLKTFIDLLNSTCVESEEEGRQDLPPGVLLKNARIANSMTQKKMAEILGIKQTQVSEMESGVRRIPETIALKISERFGIESSRLLNQ